MELIKILSEEKELLIKMLDILKAEKQILINEDIKGLEEINKKKEELKSKIEEAEKIRIKECKGMKLKDMLMAFEGKEREELERLGKEIEDLVYNIQNINEINQQLIKQSLNYIKTVLQLLSQPKVKIYNPTGRLNENNASSGVIDRSV